MAGVLVLLRGVRMFLGEIIPAFKGISESWFPEPDRLSTSIFYSVGPMATTVGFLAAMVGGIISTMITTRMNVVVLPGVIGLFFMGGAANVFGDKLGGKKGAVANRPLPRCFLHADCSGCVTLRQCRCLRSGRLMVCFDGYYYCVGADAPCGHGVWSPAVI